MGLMNTQSKSNDIIPLHNKHAMTLWVKVLQLDLFKHHEIELKDKSLNRKKYFFFKVNNGIVSVWKYTGKTSG